MNTRNTIAFWSALVSVAALVFVTGCEDKRRHQPSAGVISASQPALAEDASPAEVVRAFIAVIQEAQRVRSSGLGTRENRQAYDRAMATIAGLAARSQIHQNMVSMKSTVLPADLTEGAAVTMISESWVSMAAYYADGFLYETLRVPAVPAGTNAILSATIEAVRPRDQARLEEIERMFDENPPKDAQGNPIPHDSEAFLSSLRAKTLSERPPFNVPVRARFHLKLSPSHDGWRVLSLQVEPAAHASRRPPYPTSQPAGPLVPPPQPASSPTAPEPLTSVPTH